MNDFDKAILSARGNAKTERIQQLIVAYTREYERTANASPKVSYERGWFTLNGSKYRLATFIKAYETLKARPNHPKFFPAQNYQDFTVGDGFGFHGCHQ